MSGLPASLVLVGATSRDPVGTCDACGNPLYYAYFEEMTVHNPPGCPMRTVRGRYAKDWTEEEWEAERAAHPEENIRPW